jgi:hypothetical protein
MSKGWHSAFVTAQPCHGEPFFGEAISPLSGYMGRLGIASSQRTLLAMTSTTVLRQGYIVTCVFD